MNIEMITRNIDANEDGSFGHVQTPILVKCGLKYRLKLKRYRPKRLFGKCAQWQPATKLQYGLFHQGADDLPGAPGWLAADNQPGVLSPPLSRRTAHWNTQYVFPTQSDVRGFIRKPSTYWANIQGAGLKPAPTLHRATIVADKIILRQPLTGVFHGGRQVLPNRLMLGGILVWLV